MPTHHVLDMANFFEGADHGEKKPHSAASPCPEHGPQLRLKEFGVGDAKAGTTPAHERVGLLRGAEVRDVFVAPNVQRANGHSAVWAPPR